MTAQIIDFEEERRKRNEEIDNANFMTGERFSITEWAWEYEDVDIHVFFLCDFKDNRA